MGISKPQTSNINTPKTAVKDLQIEAQTRLPTQHGEFQCMVFRQLGGLEYVALVKGEIAGKKEVLCRIHSECLTGEVFGSLKCDCKQQLEMALQEIQKSDCGVLLYLRQEGRGIGLANKIKAYALQEKGLDTVDANQALGLPVDARDYVLAALMLKHLKVGSVRLLTNNPLKIKALQEAGIEVSRQQLKISPVSSQAVKYVLVKQKRLGHFEA